jgi:hypothetical protein
MKEKKLNIPLKGIWSHKNANKWEEGYVAGNGEIGAILHGDPRKSILTGNHHRLFLKGNDMYNLPDLGRNLSALREVIQENGYQKGIEFFEEMAINQGYSGLTMSDLYHPAFQLQFEMMTSENSECMNYIRTLDYEKGLIKQNYTINEKQEIEEHMFVSKKQNSIVYSMASNDYFDLKINLVNFEEPLLNQTLKIKKDGLTQKNVYVDGSFYETNVLWDSTIVAKNSSDRTIEFNKIKNIHFIIDISLNGKKVKEPKLNYDSIVNDHKKDHQKKYSQTSLELVDNSERLRSVDDILKELNETKEVPLVLYEKMYDSSRYILHASTGKALPNLQGIWSGDFSPAWSGDYTLDTNVQLAISSLNSLGLHENMEGFFSRIEEYLPDFEENAKKYYNARGYLVPVHASTTAKHVHWNSEWPLVFWLAGSGWLAHFFQEYFEYTNDLNFLIEKAIPFYENTLLFFEDFIQMENEQAIIRPSYSAENGMGDNATMDVAVIKETIKNLINAYDLTNRIIPDKYKELYKLLPQYAINEEGSLKEWIDPKKEENYSHRHFSQFYPIFQSKEITKKDKELWQAAHTAFEHKMSSWVLNPDSVNSSSHGRIHAAMCAIALERPTEVELSIEMLLKNRAMYDTLVTSHYNNQEVFNIDANGALPKIYHDALLYTEKKYEFTLMKAVPKWLEKGIISGIYLAGQIKIKEMNWDLSEGEVKMTCVSVADCRILISISDTFKMLNCDQVKENTIGINLKKDIPKEIVITFQ